MGILKGSLGQNFVLLGIPKTHKSLGILTLGTKVGIGAVNQGQKDKNAVFQKHLKPFWKKNLIGNCLSVQCMVN